MSKFNDTAFLWCTGDASCYVRAGRFPYTVLSGATAHWGSIRAILESNPGAYAVREPVGAFSLSWQWQNLRWDDRATKVLQWIKPNLELAALENIAMGERVIPVYPTDNLLFPDLGKCTCSQGIRHPHPAYHPCLPIEDAIQDECIIDSIVTALPGLAWRRVVDGALLPLLPGVLSVDELPTNLELMRLGHPLW
jgi:hypothetical protein